MNTGWRFEGHRHSLAAKGISTKNAFYARMRDEEIAAVTKKRVLESELNRLDVVKKQLEANAAQALREERDINVLDTLTQIREVENEIEYVEDRLEDGDFTFRKPFYNKEGKK
jgi:hypothetical protein